MSITAAELIEYGVADIPTDDVSLTGGAIDATRRPVFVQISSAEKLNFVSSASDTRNITVVGRDSTGASISETFALNGTTPVLSTNTYQRILSVNAATSNSNTVTCTGHTSSTTFFTIPPNEVGVYIFFQNAFSTSSGQVRYEKCFFKNTDGTLTLTSSQMTLTADPSTVTQMGIATSIGDSATIANRLAVPAGPTFVGVGSAQSLPSSGNLAAGSAIGIWVQQTLAINNTPLESTFTLQLSGNTT